MNATRYIMIGGFLGAGKTTAVLQLARHLRDQGRRVGLITNDQSYGLVDTAMLEAHGFPVEEITGGCFCCKFGSLVSAADRLSADLRPDVFLAEPVGSCTDLKATVDYPLRRMYGSQYVIAPLTVLVDPVRAMRILDLMPGKSFSSKVRYVYSKQLEEADLIAVNKMDLIDGAQFETLKGALRERFPRAQILTMSARRGEGIPEWLDLLSAGPGETGAAMEVDYDTYAEGEALLGWLNTTVNLVSGQPFDGNAVILALSADVQARVEQSGGEIAHLKLVLSPSTQGNDQGVVNLVSSGSRPEASHLLQETLSAGELILNLRAEADPETLRRLVTASLEAVGAGHSIDVVIEHIEAFRPGRPVPTHRLANARADA